MGLDLVTGGGGYMGSYVVRALLAKSRRVRVMDVQKTPYCPPEAEFFQGDISDRAAVQKALDGIERVFHIAFVQSLSMRPEAERYRINIGGMENLLQESRAAGVGRFVFASTIEIYGTRPPHPCLEGAPTEEPVGWYGRHKLLCEEMLWRFSKETGLPCVVLRMPTICGKGFYNHRPLLSLMDRILENEIVGVAGDGSTDGDFVLLDDVVQGFLLAGEKKEALGEAFNISSKEGASSQEATMRAMIEAVGSKSRVFHIPAFLARIG